MKGYRSFFKSLPHVSECQRIILFVFLLASTLTILLAWVYLLPNTQSFSNINQFVEAISGRSSGWLGQAGLLLPLGFAFGAGMAAAINPCGFPMIPAYIAMYLGSDGSTSLNTAPRRQIIRSLYIGTMVTIGFSLLFGVAGILLTVGTRVLMLEIIPFLGVAIGVLLIFLGLWIMCGLKFYTGFAARIAFHIGDSKTVNAKGYFLFGISYAVASLSCTIPIFLTVVGTSVTVGDFIYSFLQFVLFALGMGTVIISLTVSMAVLRQGIIRWYRNISPVIQPVCACLMFFAGLYIVFYWITGGEVIELP
ncbi:MAG: cytochrome c biogenesis protein CcdA [Dehalococcoidia bacterium]|nr:cytochrome c biogenesis protein CcdA [Dehalococcoidia bacterium]